MVSKSFEVLYDLKMLHQHVCYVIYSINTCTIVYRYVFIYVLTVAKAFSYSLLCPGPCVMRMFFVWPEPVGMSLGLVLTRIGLNLAVSCVASPCVHSVYRLGKFGSGQHDIELQA